MGTAGRLFLATTLLFSSKSPACDPRWSVQGIIDWTGYYYGSNTGSVQKVYDQQWNLLNQDLATHTANDGYVFLPRDEDFDADIPFGTLTGAGVVHADRSINSDCIDWYNIWIWSDVNGNGKADNKDLVWQGGELKKQDWQLLVHVADKPGPLRPTDGQGDIANLLKTGTVEIHAGAHYLLLLEVHAHVSNGRGGYLEGSSLEFKGSLTVPSDQYVQIEFTAKASSSGWDPQDENLKYFTAEGNPLDSDGNSTTRANGVDNREILWIRVNNPPRGPRH
jgi:hypothetical protein